MKRIIMMLTVAAFMVVAMSVTAPLAFASPQSDCESQTGYTYTNNQGTKSCTGPGTPNDKFSCTEAQQGNVGISGTEDTNVKGNKNTNGTDTNSAHCK